MEKETKNIAMSMELIILHELLKIFMNLMGNVRVGGCVCVFCETNVIDHPRFALVVLNCIIKYLIELLPFRLRLLVCAFFNYVCVCVCISHRLYRTQTTQKAVARPPVNTTMAKMIVANSDVFKLEPL